MLTFPAAVTCKVKAFVYTSTTNVVFHGKEIIDGDETLPLADASLQVDRYSITKGIAEKIVLDSNGKLTTVPDKYPGDFSGPIPVQPGKGLRTCAIRPAGIYGEDEERHFPRIVVSVNALLYNDYSLRFIFYLLAFNKPDLI